MLASTAEVAFWTEETTFWTAVEFLLWEGLWG